ncbi:MAG TPA: DUF4406 domain-containing protein [Polyangiaceae bacterium]|nr:DUF4406 domain-containing protein [Polyangiaceae bacterium]
MIAAYMAHPLGAGAQRELNNANALRWFGWLSQSFHVAVSANWLLLASVWPETAEYRARALEIDLELVSRCDEIWLVGGRVSEGMALERAHAARLGKRIVDLTPLGYEPPIWSYQENAEFKQLVEELFERSYAANENNERESGTC